MSAAKIFKRIFTRKYLTQIFHTHIAKSNAVGLDRIRAKNFQPKLKLEVEGIVRRVENRKYGFTPYKQKLVSKGPNKSPRVISIPTVRDRITLRALCNFFIELFPNLNLEIPQIKIESLKVALATKEFDSFIKIDLSSFYSSIPQEKLLTTLKKRIRKKEIIELIHKAIKTPTVISGKRSNDLNNDGIPQGLAISNVLAEIYIHEFDVKMQSKSFFYQRYVDDILILCKSAEVDKIAEDAYKILQNMGLTPHPISNSDSKSVKGSLNAGFDYLGYRIEYPKISVRKSTILKFESGLANIFTTYRYQLLKATKPAEKYRAIKICEWRLNLRITGCIFDDRRLGWMFYFSQVDSTSPLRAIDSTIQSLVSRFGLDGKIRVKSLVKAFYETRRTNKESHKYIINFDSMSVTEMRELLENFLVSKKLSGHTDEQIKSYFKMRISAVVKELERDLVTLS